ncbi:MAG: hypothetical protein J5J06_06450 [Phycisphaerae bacterium]|nr:hypothetical protein [Phycisphaerae bacterium]
MDDLESRILYALRFIQVDGLTIDANPPRRLTLRIGVPRWLLYVWVRRRDEGPDFDRLFDRALKAIEADGYVVISRSPSMLPVGDLWAKRPDGLDVFISVNIDARLARAFVGTREGTGLRNAVEACEQWFEDGIKLWRLTPEGSRLAAGNDIGTLTEKSFEALCELLPEDIYILKRLRDANGIALCVTGQPVVGVCLADPNNPSAPKEKTIGKRLRYLSEKGLAQLFDKEHPRKGWVITTLGREALARVVGN